MALNLKCDMERCGPRSYRG